MDQIGFDTNPKGGNRLWRMQWAWFREIDVLKNENLNFDSPQVKIHPNSSETIPFDQTGIDTNPKGGNLLWRMQWTWFREIDVLKNDFDTNPPQLVQNMQNGAQGLQYEPEGWKSTMENAMGMVLRNRVPWIEVLTRIRHNSSHTC